MTKRCSKCGLLKVPDEFYTSNRSLRCKACIKDYSRQSNVKSRTPEYNIWNCMIQRCNNPSNSNYPHYGGRGIRVCERWHTFELFLADMGKRPTLKHTLDRVNNDGDYEPGNCRWAFKKEQTNNTRRNIRITYRGQTKTLAQWCEELSLGYDFVRSRLRDGWSPERALSEPLKQQYVRKKHPSSAAEDRRVYA